MTSQNVSGAILARMDGGLDEKIPLTDRGLNYGDGLFETILIRDGRPCLWTRHWRRLALGCRRLAITAPAPEILLHDIRSLLRGVDSGVLKLLLTRGDGGRGYRPNPSGIPRMVLTLFPMPDYPENWTREGVVTRLCDTPAAHSPALAGLKTLNRLENVLARGEWDDPQVAEGLMSSPDGDIIGGTMTNLFLWDGARLLTPSVERCGIAGTVRELALELAAGLGIQCVQTRIWPDDLTKAQGLFLTNAVAGVWPVLRLHDHRFDSARLPRDFIAALRRDAQSPEGIVS